MSKPLTLGTEPLTLADLRLIARGGASLKLSEACTGRIDAAAALVAAIVDSGETVYGVNTGIGKLAMTRIARDQLERLQRNIVLSHAAGTGPLLDDQAVRLVLALKVACLAQGYSGVRREVIERLVAIFNSGVCPPIPAKGSVGASGDLAPLAHLAAYLLEQGMVLGAKEGIALINGTQVSTALALKGLFDTEDAFAAAVLTGALSVDAAAGSDAPFDPRIQTARGQRGQIDVAARYRELLAGSEIRESHRVGDPRVQDPYSLRCQPQVMGACLEQMRYAAGVFQAEANGVSDNPLVFADTGELVSGGNFHAEPVALAADALAIAIAEIGSMSERRTALLVDANFSGLPAFLVPESGLNSGFMLAHVTAAALTSENKLLSHPASVDSIPTSANQEDFVSMATHGARRLGDMAENCATIVAIELLAAAQGVELRAPLRTSARLNEVVQALRSKVPFYAADRYFAPDIEAAKTWVRSGAALQWVAGLLPSTA